MKKNYIIRWLTKPAKWYQFWIPQSGIVGGAICYFIGIGTGLLIRWLLKL